MSGVHNGNIISGIELPPQHANLTRRIVADVDVGIDDAWALFMLLKAESDAHPLKHRLLGITCVSGNTNVDQVATNVLRVLQCAGRTDVSTCKYYHSIMKQS